MLFASAASAQEILPFPPVPSASKAGLTIETSTYKKRVEPKHLKDGAPNILIILMDGPLYHPDGRRRAGHPLDLRWRDQYAHTRPGGEAGGLLQPFPFHRHVLAHAGVTAHRAQSHLCRQWPDRGDRQRLRRLFRRHSEVVGDGRGSAQELRLQHGCLGQVAQHARRADHQQRAVRLLADRLRFRVFLRIPGRRGFAVRTDPDAQHHRCHPASEEGLPPHRGHRRGRHQVAARTESLCAGQAVLHVLGAGRIAWPAPDHEGVGRQVQRQVRRRLGQVSRACFRPGQGQGLDPAGRATHAASRFHGFVGLHSRGRETVPASPDGSVRRLHRARRLQRGEGHRRNRASGQTRQHADLLHLGRQRFLVGGP